jgi:NitT/TauT family transport system permease protein
MRDQVASALLAGGLVLTWELAVRVLQVPDFILPPPSLVLEALWKWREPIAADAAVTLLSTLIGFAAAVVFGLAVGALIGSSTRFYAMVYPLLIGFNSIPKVAIVPLLVLWFGIGIVPAALTAFLISFFPIVVNVATGVATLEPELEDVLRSLGATRYEVMTKIGLPRSMPYFFASLKVAITMAFVGAIVSETVASNSGIGHLMIVASSRFETKLVFAGLFVTAAMGVLMYVAASQIEERMIGWAMRGRERKVA